jgi:N6-adenosine-specific RNA methylase IME4
MSKLPRFSVIYADPPWGYKDDGQHASSTLRGAAANQYPTLSNQTIAALPVHLLAEPDCVLFMWATNPLLPEAFAAIAGWGFTYKTVAFDWVKLTSKDEGKPFFGLGRWTRGNTEKCLLAVRGKPQRAGKAVSQLLVSPKLAHSAKPAETRDKIVELCGDVSRVELFAREHTDGWEATGLDLDGADLRDVLTAYEQANAGSAKKRRG